MYSSELLEGRVTTCGLLDTLQQAGSAQEGERRRDARLVLGVRQGVVAKEQLVVVERDGQDDTSETD